MSRIDFAVLVMFNFHEQIGLVPTRQWIMDQEEFKIQFESLNHDEFEDGVPWNESAYGLAEELRDRDFTTWMQEGMMVASC